MVSLGIGNSRMKDFAFDGPTLAAAIGATFSRRGTTLPPATTTRSSASGKHSDAATRRSECQQFVMRRGRTTADENGHFQSSIHGNDHRTRSVPHVAPACAHDRPAVHAARSPGGPWHE